MAGGHIRIPQMIENKAPIRQRDCRIDRSRQLFRTKYKIENEARRGHSFKSTVNRWRTQPVRIRFRLYLVTDSYEFVSSWMSA